MNILNIIISFLTTSITLILSLAYYYYLYNYIDELRKTKECNQRNQPYLEIFYNIVIISFILSVSYIIYFICLVYGYINISSIFKISSYLIKYSKIIYIISILINLLIIYLLYEVSKQEICKDINSNFRLFIIIISIIGLLSDFKSLYNLFIQSLKFSNKKK